jgi:hypothetical protein
VARQQALDKPANLTQLPPDHMLEFVSLIGTRARAVRLGAGYRRTGRMNMGTGSLIGALALVTLGIGLAIGVFMWFRARRSQHKRGEHLTE